jgi:hypothetical protein
MAHSSIAVTDDGVVGTNLLGVFGAVIDLLIFIAIAKDIRAQAYVPARHSAWMDM